MCPRPGNLTKIGSKLTTWIYINPKPSHHPIIYFTFLEQVHRDNKQGVSVPWVLWRCTQAFVPWKILRRRHGSRSELLQVPTLNLFQYLITWGLYPVEFFTGNSIPQTDIFLNFLFTDTLIIFSRNLKNSVHSNCFDQGWIDRNICLLRKQKL